MDQDHKLRNTLWKNRWLLFSLFMTMTVFWLLTLTVPYLYYAGELPKTQFAKLGFVLPLVGITFGFSCFSKSSPIYRMGHDDVPSAVLFGLVLFLLPVLAHLDEIQQIEIAKVLKTPAWITSLILGLISGTLFFLWFRRKFILLGGPIILGAFGISVGALFGVIVFKLISLAF